MTAPAEGPISRGRDGSSLPCGDPAGWSLESGVRAVLPAEDNTDQHENSRERWMLNDKPWKMNLGSN